MPGVILLYSRYRDSTNIVTKDYQTTAEALVTAGQFLAEKGWAPATSGNYSARLDGETGRHHRIGSRQRQAGGRRHHGS